MWRIVIILIKIKGVSLLIQFYNLESRKNLIANKITSKL